MALVRYYKFNNNLLDSSGYGFDLGTSVGSPVYQSGILGQGITGSPNPYTPYWGAVASGARPNAVLGPDVYHADNPNGAFSITFWMKINNINYSASVISLEGATGPWTTIEYYGGSPAQLYFNYAEGIASVEAPENEWFFVCYYLDPADHYFYLSVNNGTPVANGYALEVAYNILRVGSFNAYSPFGAQIDDLRIYNHKLTPAEISQIYNLGDPSEIETPNVTDWAIPIHQHRLNGSLVDNVGAVTATATFTNYKGSGLFSASSNAISLEDDNDSVETNDASFGGATLNNGSFSIAFWYEASGTSGATLYPQFLCGPINKTTSDLGYPYGVTTFEGYELVNGSGPGVTDPVGLTSSFGAYVYNHVVQRFTAYGINANNEFYVIGQVATARQNADITGWSFTNGENATPCTSYVDEVRYYDRALTGLDALELFNSGVGTQQYGISASAIGSLLSRTVVSLAGSASGESSATGASNQVSISSLDGSAAGGATPLVSFLPILMPPPSAEGTGDGITSTNANGLFETVEVEQLIGSAFGEQNVSLSISFATINVRPQLNQPVHNYKFENSLRDSYSANVITSGYAQPLAELSYVASSQFVPGLGSFARRATTYGQIYQPIMSGFATGPTVWDSTAYTQRSYTFSLWLQFPYTTLDQNPTGGNNSASTITLHFASVRLYLTLPKGSVSCPYYVNWTPTQPGGGLSTTLASGAIQPGPVTVPAGNQVGGKFFIAITYNHVSQTARVVTGESGTLSSFPSASLAPSNYDFGEPGGSVSIVGSNAFSPITGVATIGAYFDDFRVYNYALNEYEIANIYNNGAGDVIPAQGFGVGAFAPITIYSIAGSAFSTYGGPLETVNLVTLNGSASGTQSSTTSGTLAEITVTPFGAIAQGNPFGPFATLSVVPFAGTASYTPASGFPIILIRSVAGRATGSSVRSASFATLSISSLSGSGAGSATNSSNLAAITISSLAGSSAGNGLASASFAGLTIVNHAGSASGSGNSSGASNTITITTLSGSAASNALASSAFSIITILPLAGSAIGQGSATGSSNTITVTSFSGAVAALANTSGMLSIIQVQVFTGSIVTNGNAVGPLGGGPGFPLFNGTAIRLDSIQPPLGGVAFGGTAKFINAPFNTVILTPLEGTGIGNVLNVYLNSQPFSSVSITSQQGSAIGSSLGGGNFGLQPPVIQLSLGSAGLSVSASTSGPLQTITVQSLSGTSQGAAIIAGSLSVVAVSPLQGSSIGSSVISAVFQTASILPPNGSASSSIIVSGSLTAITIGAFSGGTTVGVTALSQGATIVVLPILGSPNGTNIVSGGRASVTTYHSI